MKKLNITLSLILCLLLFGCSANKPPDGNSAVDYGNLDLANIYSTLEELTDASDLIAEVSITGDSEKVAYEGANFTLSQAKMKEIIKGHAQKDPIKIFEVARYNINLVPKKSNTFILFLDRYEGPVLAEEAYVITGVYQGKFNVNNQNKIIYDAVDYNGEMTFQNKFHLMDANEFKKVVREEANK